MISEEEMKSTKLPRVIVPTVGRVVWYWHGHTTEDAHMKVNGMQPMKADVVYVWGDRMVNLSIFDHNGVHFARTSVTLVQEGDAKPQGGRFCEWMPYQTGQAAKSEKTAEFAKALEEKLNELKAQKAEAAEKTLAQHHAEQAAKLDAKPGVDPFEKDRDFESSTQ